MSSEGQIESLKYRFYNADEVRALSVRAITNESAFDRLTGRGVDGGLHDVSLGPNSEKDICGHCGLDFFTCPGHFGHIEFAKPMFNPVFFDVLLKLMRSFCFSCFRLYSVEYLAAALHHLGAPASSLPGKPRQIDIQELAGLSAEDQRQVGLRALCSRPRIPCKLCCSRSWMIRHINKQQIGIRPVSENARTKAAKAEALAGAEEGGIEELLAIVGDEDPRLISNRGPGTEVVNYLKSLTEKDNEQDAALETVRKELATIAKSCGSTKDSCLLPEFARLMLRCLWNNDGCLLGLLFPMLKSASSNHEHPTDIFFLDNVLLSPSICRLPRYVAGLAYEHPETAVFSRIVKRAECLSNIVQYMHQQEENLAEDKSLAETPANTSEAQINTADGASRAEGALKLATVLLQGAVNGLYDGTSSMIPTGLDSKMDWNSQTGSAIRLPGIRQRLEKKQGLFRMHIMGKRVNYACRSVISPDPNLDVTEVGIPLFFARRLTFPSPVTAFNLTQMRQLVANGPENYPGARSLRTPDGRLILLPRGNTAQAVHRREVLARRLAPLHRSSEGTPFVVNRHLLDGDMLIMNRQPTLHRPSMQSHRVRIIHSNEAKTLRMHYSNCRAYNADFDGDEMNGHLVQSYPAQAELEGLASVPHHYLVPKDGSPLGGLIQDHVIAAVKLTMRDRFFDHADYVDLVYHALRSVFNEARRHTNGPPNLITLPPAIMWPRRLWTGKQVISTLLMNLTPPGLPHLNLCLRGRRTKAELWSGVAPGQPILLSDVDVVVCDGYLASGMLDKSHIGSSSGGLVHCVYEIYGPSAASHLLNGIGLLSNRLLKFTAFTMGIKDMLLSDHSNFERSRRFEGLRDLGLCAFADAFELKPEELSESTVLRLYRQAHFADTNDQVMSKRLGQLDIAMKNRLKRAQDAVCDAAIPSGLYVPFPENNLQLMVHIGAKGGMVNAQQMSVALGQIELEGRRVPLMLSGRSLPSFPPYDVRPRAGGMCTHRFLTSLPPQELFFHSMAGRDGLVDTAVKTSRSGYLQRSAIKHLEDVSIQYDGTVRDAGGNVVQFRYGDDGVDVCQSGFLKPTGLHLFADNAALLGLRWRSFEREEHEASYSNLLEKNPLPEPLQVMADEVGTQRQMILFESLPPRKISKMFRRARRAHDVFVEAKEGRKNLSKLEILHSDLPPPPCSIALGLRQLCVAKLISSQAPPGDPVGLLAAQSVGEPSTQMTLNTFHFAGRGEMNVTLGIPRLREILMLGSPQISTPCMEVPVRSSNKARRCCTQIAKRLYKLKLVEALKLPIAEKVDYASDSYTLEFHLQPQSAYSQHSHVRPSRVLRFLERVLFPDLARRLDAELKDQGKITLIRSFALSALARLQNSSAGTGRAGEEADETQAENEATKVGASKSRARDEWNEDDGQEAVRRRRMEDEAEEEGDGRVIDLDELADLVMEDDAEAAELREIGEDPDQPREDDNVSEREDNGNSDGNNKKAKKPGPKSVVVDDVIVVDEGDDEAELAHEFEAEDSNHAKIDEETEFEAESRRTFVSRLHARFSNYDFDRSKTPTWARLTICVSFSVALVIPLHGYAMLYTLELLYSVACCSLYAPSVILLLASQRFSTAVRCLCTSGRCFRYLCSVIRVPEFFSSASVFHSHSQCGISGLRRP
ncbi:unnamed protein product [Calicophoron daubneyi]|uniref:DNA-directed RNA polymerase subunit n=1 Tax=Calicophoron daubneyi TaxID=300641 RepID=A0AAV2TFC9_CALDB